MNHGPHRDVRAFKPSSAAEAKAFLRQIAIQLPTGISNFGSETPRSSRTVKWKGRQPDMICHGCHGPMGGGAHNGSAIGKNNCTLLHHPSCPGGVEDDVNWRACTAGYVHQQLPETGFEQSLLTQDFLPTEPVRPVTEHITVTTDLQPGPGLSDQNPSHLSGQQQGGRPQFGSHLRPQIPLSLSSQPDHQVSEDMQRQMDQLRAVNQVQAENRDRPLADDLTIRDLRADPDLLGPVNDQMSDPATRCSTGTA